MAIYTLINIVFLITKPVRVTEPRPSFLDCYSNSSAHLLLADSLRMKELCDGHIPIEQQKLLGAAVVDDAHLLLGYVLPHDKQIAFGITDAATPSTSFEVPPSLRDLYLIAEAYDATGDTSLRDSLEYILDTCPPALAEELAEAYEQAAAKGTSIFAEYRSIVAKVDDRLDLTSWLNASGDSTPKNKRTPEESLESTQASAVIIN